MSFHWDYSFSLPLLLDTYYGPPLEHGGAHRLGLEGQQIEDLGALGKILVGGTEGTRSIAGVGP